MNRLAIGIMILIPFPACAALQENTTLTAMAERKLTIPADAVTIIDTVASENEIHWRKSEPKIRSGYAFHFTD